MGGGGWDGWSGGDEREFPVGGMEGDIDCRKGRERETKERNVLYHYPRANLVISQVT